MDQEEIFADFVHQMLGVWERKTFLIDQFHVCFLTQTWLDWDNAAVN